jgi:hypothetical protein
MRWSDPSAASRHYLVDWVRDTGKEPPAVIHLAYYQHRGARCGNGFLRD